MIWITHYDSPLGGVTIAADGAAITGLWFDGQKYFGSTLPDEVSSEIELSDVCGEKLQAFGDDELPVFKEAKRWLDIYFSGKDPGFTPPLNFTEYATEFRCAVWETLLEIPFGETVTYKEIAERVAQKRGQTPVGETNSSGMSVSARAVGGAVGHNPISLIVPCHRVLGADGKLTGYAGGIDKKTALLKLEGARIIR